MQAVADPALQSLLDAQKEEIKSSMSEAIRVNNESLTAILGQHISKVTSQMKADFNSKLEQSAAKRRKLADVQVQDEIVDKEPEEEGEDSFKIPLPQTSSESTDFVNPLTKVVILFTLVIICINIYTLFQVNNDWISETPSDRSARRAEIEYYCRAPRDAEKDNLPLRQQLRYSANVMEAAENAASVLYEFRQVSPVKAGEPDVLDSLKYIRDQSAGRIRKLIIAAYHGWDVAREVAAKGLDGDDALLFKAARDKANDRKKAKSSKQQPQQRRGSGYSYGRGRGRGFYYNAGASLPGLQLGSALQASLLSQLQQSSQQSPQAQLLSLPAPAAAGTPRVCYNCRQTGHISRDCPFPKKDVSTAK